MPRRIISGIYNSVPWDNGNSSGPVWRPTSKKKRRKATPERFLTINQKADRLRARMSPGERAIWKSLRAMGFKAQVPILQRYIADFYHESRRIVVEIDGSQHQKPDARAYDQARDADMARARIRTIRFSVAHVFRDFDGVLDQIRREVFHDAAAAIPCRSNAAEPGARGRRAASREAKAAMVTTKPRVT